MRMILKVLAAVVCLSPAFFTASATADTSEEYPPLICGVNQFVVGLTCRGGYCDNVGVTCDYVGGLRWNGGARFMPYVSEEGRGRRNCPRGYAVAGLACQGGYCDNVSLLCIQTGGSLRSCTESRFVSEEGGGRLRLPQGRVATGVICTGGYCDNKSLVNCVGR